MSKNCHIMSRMKNNYESRSRAFLTRRIPVIMRLDGKAFHTYTKDLNKPFDEGLIEDIQQTAIYLCQNIQGAKCAYVQSDEISILITDYDKLTSEAWFDYEVQKMTSISGSLAAGIFNILRNERSHYNQIEPKGYEFLHKLKPNWSLANFDSRVFNIPKEEVVNYFLARQRDAVKNSISMLAQSLYPHKELEYKNSSDEQEMCLQKGYNWNDLHWSKKRGSFIIKQTYVNGQITSDKREIGKIWIENGSAFKFVQKENTLEIDIEEISKAKIRNHWEVTETPLAFTNDIFKKWL